MRNVKFERGEDGNYFTYNNGKDNGESGSFEYKFSITSLWNPLNQEDFIVELLINPFLNKESNVYALLNSDDNKRVGYVFPISVLDSDSDFSSYKYINNYVYVAFYQLLQRISSIKENSEFFSDNFEDNVCVCVIQRKSVGMEYPLCEMIHSLRKLGYSYFEPNNSIKAVSGYDNALFLNSIKSNIRVEIRQPSLYRNPIIDTIMRFLPRADNLTHRFVLLYQVIETLLEEISSENIESEIQKFRSSQIPSNDFQENIKRLSSERNKIGDIFEKCHLQNTQEANNFNDCCKKLFALVRYVPSSSTLSDYFYSFRNQMTHSYRKLYQNEKELAETIQSFEILVMKIIETYPYRK